MDVVGWGIEWNLGVVAWSVGVGRNGVLGWRYGVSG